MTDEQKQGALIVTKEWDAILAVLAADVLDNAEMVKEVGLKIPGHPFYLGKLSLIKALRAMVQDDLKRFGETDS